MKDMPATGFARPASHPRPALPAAGRPGGDPMAPAVKTALLEIGRLHRPLAPQQLRIQLGVVGEVYAMLLDRKREGGTVDASDANARALFAHLRVAQELLRRQEGAANVDPGLKLMAWHYVACRETTGPADSTNPPAGANP